MTANRKEGRHAIAYDGWNQAAAREFSQTVRSAQSEGESDDLILKVCMYIKKAKDKRYEVHGKRH